MLSDWIRSVLSCQHCALYCNNVRNWRLASKSRSMQKDVVKCRLLFCFVLVSVLLPHVFVIIACGSHPHRHTSACETLPPCNPSVIMYPALAGAGGLSFRHAWPSSSSPPAGRCSLLHAISLPSNSLLANHEPTTNPPGRPPAFPFPAQSPFTTSCRRWVVVSL